MRARQDKIATILQRNNIFPFIFLYEICCILIQIPRSNWQLASIGLVNDLVPNRQQAIIWTIDSHNELISND